MIKLSNVRLSFPSIWETEKYNDVDTGKFAATFILDKDNNKADLIDINNHIALGIKQKLNGTKLSLDLICLKDGDESNRDEYSRKYYIKATNKFKPQIFDRSKNKLTKEDNVIYAGCFVNAIIEIWFQNNIYGKRVNASLLGIQFSKDGEPFNKCQISIIYEFEKIEYTELPF